MKLPEAFVCVLMLLVLLYESLPKTADCDNFVPDEKTAMKIAEAVWLPIYGDAIYQKKPFTTKLVDGKIWQVSGTLQTRKGGVPYIEIQKCDCKVLKVEHGK